MRHSISLMYRDGIGRLQLWNCSCALHTVLIPSSCGMFVYKHVASKDTKIVSVGTLALFIKLISGWCSLSTWHRWWETGFEMVFFYKNRDRRFSILPSKFQVVWDWPKSQGTWCFEKQTEVGVQAVNARSGIPTWKSIFHRYRWTISDCSASTSRQTNMSL